MRVAIYLINMKDLSLERQTVPGEHSQKGRTMRQLILSTLLFLFLVGNITPAYSQTYEDSKKAQVERALKGPDGAQIKKSVNKYSEMYKVEPALVHAVILTESGYNKNAVSAHGAKGLGQFMDPTFRARNVGNNIFDIDQNTHATAKHLGGLRDKYKGNIYVALGAYNAGPANVSVDKPLPNYVKKYVNRVMYHKMIIESMNVL